MIICATADIHSPLFYDLFVSAIENLKVKPDLFLLAGDMIERGDVKEFEKVWNAMFGKIDCPIVACFGNNEFDEIRDFLKQKYPKIRFLDDQSIELEIKGLRVGIFGSTGSLDEPTSWQKRNIPNIEMIYERRRILAEKHLERMRADFKILLLHYAPTYKTLEGENPRIFKNLGSIVFENVILKQKPNLVIHGHSHRGKKIAWVDKVPVYNVALPVWKEIVVIDTERDLKPGLARFV